VLTALGLFAWVTEVSVRDRKDPPYLPDTVPSDPDVAAPKRTGDHAQVNFWKEVYPILESSCLQCHGPQKAHAGFRVDRREDYFGNKGKAAFIVSGKSAQSPLIAIVQGQRTDIAMAANHKLSERAVAVLRAWIDAGAEWPEKHDAK
jgi:hypothetical protein